MWELSESIDGMAEACTEFGIPVVGGNVSLYNASRGSDIDPTLEAESAVAAGTGSSEPGR